MTLREYTKLLEEYDWDNLDLDKEQDLLDLAQELGIEYKYLLYDKLMEGLNDD